MGRILTIAGNMGSGKTSLVEFLQRRFDVRAMYEPNDENPYLNDFYSDMPRWALHSQLFFLIRKAGLYRAIQRGQRPALLDRSIYEDAEIFARNLSLCGHIGKRDYALYRMAYEQLLQDIRPPDLLIFLRCGLKTLKQRIALRGREMEQDVDDRYLKRLNRLYANWIKDYKLSPVVEIRTDKIDYITDLTHQIDMLKLVERALKG